MNKVKDKTNIFEEGGKYYFFGECGDDEYGPYNSPEEAEEELESYSEWLNFQDEEKEKWANQNE